MAWSALIVLLGCAGRTAGGGGGGTPSGGVREDSKADGGEAPAAAAAGPDACAEMLDVESQDAVGDFLSFAIFTARTIEKERDRVLAFVAMAKACRLAGMNDEFLCLLSHALEAQKAAKVEDINALDEIAGAYLEAGELDRALEIARTMEDSLHITKDRLLKEVALAYVEEGKYDRAVDAVGATQAEYEAAVPMLKITEKYLQAGKVQEAFAAFESIQDEFTKAQLLGQLMEATGDLPRVLKDAKDIKNFGHRIWALTILADSCAASGKSGAADEVLAVAAADAQANENSDERLKAMASIASAYARAGQAGTAGDLFSLVMLQMGSIAHPAVLADVCKEAALWYFKTGQDENALDAVKKIETKQQRQQVLSSIGVQLAEQGLVKKAAQVADKIKDDLDRGLVFQTIAESCAAEGKYDEALDAAKKVKDDFFRTQAIFDIAGKSAKNGDWEKFLPVMKKVLKSAKTMDKGKGGMSGGPIVMGVISSKFKILTSVVEKIEETGKMDMIPAVLGEALELADTFKAKDQRALVLTYIAQKLGRAGKAEQSFDLLSKALGLAGEVGDVADRNWVLSHIAEVYAAGGDVDKGLIAAGGIEPEEDQARTILAMIEALPKENEGDDLPLLLAKALALAGKIQDGDDRAIALIRISSKYIESGMKVNESMRKTLQEIVSTLEAKAGSNPCCCQSITGGKVKGRRAVATLARWRGWAAEGVLSAFIF